MGGKFKDISTSREAVDAELKEIEQPPAQAAPVVSERPAVSRPKVDRTTEKKKVGRPANGKRTNEDYDQTTAYVPRDLNAQVRARLFAMRKPGGQRVQYSDLITDLLQDWIRRKG